MPTREHAIPSSIGRYRIVAKLGEGGMGIVYEAEQHDPRRRVAVKVVRGGEFVDDTRARLFQREVAALARLKHVGIAGIYEAGRTDDGQHFFAMELVHGASLGDYLHRRPPPTTRAEIAHRLRLFSAICDAVHYAHQRGVIHRDLKPSNVIVSEEHSSASSRADVPVIKVLDFGLARITEGESPMVTLSADVGLVRGTLPYMSPEQAQGSPDAIDVRTDVYSLGVILYEMLSGKRPYELGGLAIAVAIRAICEEPPAPMRAPAGSEVRVDADLDTIARKALAKDPDQRYASAAALADDVQRHLASQPILARPPSALYQLRKFAERNRLLVTGALGACVLVAAAAVVATLFGVREAEQRREVERTRADLEQIVDFQDGMLADVDPEAMGRRLLANLRRRAGDGAEAAAFEAAMRSVNATDVAVDVLDEDVLKRAVETVDARFADQPLVAARLLDTLANSYAALGRAERAEPLARRSFDLREKLLGPDDPRTLDSAHTLADALYRLGRFEDASRAEREVVDARRRLLGPEHRDTLDAEMRLGWILLGWGHHDQAIELMEPAMETCRRTFGVDDLATIDAMQALASAYTRERLFDRAETIARAALEASRRTRGAEDRTTLNLMSVLGNIFQATDLHAAEKLYLDLVAVQRRLYGDDHPTTLLALDQLAIVYAQLDQGAKALEILAGVYATQRRVLGPEHEQTLTAQHNLGAVLTGLGRTEEAERILREVMDARERTLGAGNPRRLRTMYQLAKLMTSQHRLNEAEAMLNDALDAARSTTLGERGSEVRLLRAQLRDLYLSQGRFAEALPVAEAMVEYDRVTFGEDADQTLGSSADLGAVHTALGNLDHADELYTRVLAARERTQGERDERTLRTQSNLACVRVRQGRHEEAIEILQTAMDRGYKHADILVDHDFDPLRSDPRFEAMVEEVERRRSKP